MDLILPMLGLVVLNVILSIVLIFLVFHKFKSNETHTELSDLTKDFSERFSALKSQVEGIPNLTQAKLDTQNAKNTASIKEDFSLLRETLVERFSRFHIDLTKSQSEEFEVLRKSMEGSLEKISTKVRENLDEGFKKTNQTFQNVIERLAKIDEAQKKIDSLSSNVISLQDILTDKKSRGIFGEVHLKQILSSVFGENNQSVYKMQYSLSNSKIIDAAIFLPEPIGLLCVDSKFPLENFKRMLDRELSDAQKLAAQKEFVRNVKKHIDDISSKYILKGETADQAILFLPAEAIFAEIHAYHPELIDYAHQNRVWLTSPTTFLATLTTVQMILLNLERNKYMSIIHEEINRLGDEFDRYQSRWDNLAKHIDTVSKDVKQIHVTSDKISKRFAKIKQVEIEGKDQHAQSNIEQLENLYDSAKS